MRDSTKVVPVDETSIVRAAESLLAGNLIGLPTETVYGLAARGDDDVAVQSIFDAKGRPQHNPLILHVADLDDVRGLFAATLHPDLALRLDRLAMLWPGPLTVIGPRNPTVLDSVVAGGSTVAVRIPNHWAALAVLQTVKRLAGRPIPIAAPSANVSNYISPTTAMHVEAGLGGKVDLILDGGPCQVGLESTIVYLGESDSPPRILRQGHYSVETISQLLAEPIDGKLFGGKLSDRQPNNRQPIRAPGQFAKHYSPRTPVVLIEPGAPAIASGNVLRIDFMGTESAMRQASHSPGYPKDQMHPKDQTHPNDQLHSADQTHSADHWTFAPDGQLATAAKRLYDVLRQADTQGYDRIEIVACRETGIGIAIMDRLRRAAS